MIVGVAIKQGNTVYGLSKPNRHHDVIHHMAVNMKLPTPIKGEQGFYDDEGEFLNRYEARDVAIKTGQIDKCRHKRKLFSNDLW